jgi:hypothetical protein
MLEQFNNLNYAINYLENFALNPILEKWREKWIDYLFSIRYRKMLLNIKNSKNIVVQYSNSQHFLL